MLENRVFLTRVTHVSTYTYIGIKGYESSEKEKLTLRSQPQPKFIVRLVISKIERKLIVVSILYLLVVRSCSIRKWELQNPSNRLSRGIFEDDRSKFTKFDVAVFLGGETCSKCCLKTRLK